MQITFIGGGNMAAAIIGGLVRQGGHRIHVVEHQQDKIDRLAAEFGVGGGLSLPERFAPDDIVVLAIKPQQLRELCLELAPRLNGALVVSIAAGIRIEALSRWLQTSRIVRVMPNTPAMVGKGVSGLFADPAASADDRRAAETVMAAAGLTHWLDEETGIDDITCVSGSGPAYVFYFIESMIEAGMRAGFSEADARALTLATFDGAVELARQSPLPVAALRQNVMSKGGTTERAIARFEQEGVKAAIVAGAMDCRERSIEMGQQLSQE
nr:pyrroline-5-carboxylate reductase [Chromobacterium sp. ASV5]